MAEPDVVAKLREITNLDPKLHLFCEDEQRKKHAIDCLQILGFDGPDALPWHAKLGQKYDKQLGSCDRCIVNYHKGKRKFVEDLRNDYNDEDVETFVRLLDDRDIERIRRGLDNAKKTLLALPEEKRRQNAVSPSDLYAVFEALTCDSFLVNEELMASHFDETFDLLQTNKALRVMHWVPAMLRFLFDEHKGRSRWARENWAKIATRMTRDDFDFAIRGCLADNLNAAFISFPTADSVSNLWSGLRIVVDKLDGDLITHSLRAMEQDVYRLALDHLQVDSPGFGPLLQTMRTLLSKGPKDFWDAMGAIAPTTIIETIFGAPQYDQRILRSTSAETKAFLDDVLSWIEPFVASLQTSHKPQACRSLTYQLMSRLQASKFPEFAKAECYRMGLEVIYRTLMDCCEDSFHFDGVGRVVALDTLNLTFEHIGEITSALRSPEALGEELGLVNACFKTIRYALKLECNLIRTDRVKINNDDTLLPGFQPFQPKIWPAIERDFVPGNIALARICIEEISELTGLEGLESKMESRLPHEKERKQFNTLLRDFSRIICKTLEKINDFGSQDLNLLAKEQETSSYLLRILFSAEQDVQEAGLNLLKTMSGASFRKEAINHILQLSFDRTIETVIWSISRIARAKTFAACSRMLKLIGDVLDLLCDPQDGILRSQSLPPASLEIVQKLWNSLWKTLRVVYDSTLAWSHHIKTFIMTDFCRDVMQFSEVLFDHFSVFDVALRPVVDQIKDDEVEALFEHGSQDSTDLLASPCQTLEAVVGYLKLRDGWLLSQSVNLTRKILLQLTSRSMALSQSLGTKLKSMVVSSSKVVTNMTGQQKAEIRRALEDNMGHAIEDESKERSGTSTPDVELQPVTTVKPSAKQSVIDLNSWSSKAPSKEARDGDRLHPTTSVESIRAQQALKAQSKMQKATPKTTLATGMTKPLPKLPTSRREPSRAAQQVKKETFLKEREKAQLEKKRRDAEAVARAKKHLLPNSIAGITAGEGSALGNIGNMGKEHLKKNSEIMVSSSSESESDDDPVFGPLSKSKPSAAVVEYNQSRRHQLKPQQPVKKIKQARTQKDLRARVAPDLTPIHKAILGWNFFHDSDLPPGGIRDDYSMVSQAFRTAHDYRKTFEPLLLLEAWQSFRQAQEEASGKSFGIKVVNRMTVDSLVEISSTMDAVQNSERTLFEGDIMLLSKSTTPSQASDQPSCLARVFKMTRKQNAIEVTFKVAQANQLLDSLVPKAELRGEKITSLIPLEREYGALLGLVYYDLCDEIIKAYPSPLLSYNDGVLNRLVQCYELNRAQAKAVQSAIDNDAFTLIQGPPGSGKTKTIVAIVGALLTSALESSAAVPIAIPQTADGGNNQQRITVPKKLLVCAPSNAAVDELVMRFMRGIKTSNGKYQKPSIVRLGKSEAINPKVMEVTLDELVEKKMNVAVAAEKPKEGDEMHKAMLDHKATCDQLNELKGVLDGQNAKNQKASPEQYHQLEVLRRRKNQLSTRIDQLKDSGNTFTRNVEIQRNKVRQEIIDGAHILCATLSGSGHDMLRNLQLDFETVIIDEAAQSIELSALIPLKYGCSKCIMVGDPKQLPPTVLSREASRFQYEQSLFVRMQANSPENVHLLDTQYRMHPDISAFPSQAFYDGRLLDGPGMAGLRQKPWHADQLLSPYRFFDVQGMHQSAPRGHSLVNLAEINIALQLFSRLIACAKGYDFRGKVGIITPYKSQLGMLRDRFKQQYGSEIINTIEFNTTDAFQGRESEVIIFSCVRASNTGIGFLSDIRRMNVGITRAKSSLWVLGNANSLMQGEYWSRLIEDSRQRNRYTSDVLRDLSVPPKRVPVRPELTSELKQEQQKHPQDIEMVNAAPLKDNAGLDAMEANGFNRRVKAEVISHKKRSPPSPPDSSHIAKLHKSDGFEEDLKRSRQGTPLSRPSSASDNNREAEDGAKDIPQQAPKARPSVSTGQPMVRAPGSAPKAPPIGRGVRPPVPAKKKDDSAFIVPKRRPR